MTPQSIKQHGLPEVAFQRLSYSSIKEFMKSPSHYLLYRLGKLDQTEAKRKGSAFDVLLTQPHKFVEIYLEYSEQAILEELTANANPRGTKRYKEWFAELQVMAGDRELILATEAQAMVSIVLELREKYPAQLDQQTGDWQVSGSGEIDGLLYVGFADRIYIGPDGEPCILDIKTTKDAGESFLRDFDRYQYGLQAAIYREIFGISRYQVLAVELAAPYNCGLFNVSEEVLDYWRGRLRQANQRFREWDRLPAGPMIADTIYLPAWMKAK